MGWMARRTSPGSAHERGFTLAGVLVILTVMMIVVAYTVPRQWSTVMQRERELQTIFIMKQYARAIYEFGRKNGGAMPASMDQLTKAKLPRFLRGKNPEVADPLTGEVDWMIIPASAAGATGPTIPGTSGSAPSTTTPSTTATTNTTNTIGTDTTATANNGQPAVQGVPMKDYAGGPFIGIRPGKTGKSFLTFNNADTYDSWSYTVNDYRNEMNVRLAAAAKVWQ